MSADYLALTRDCTTQNQFNRVHIDLETTITPLEFAAIAQEADAGRLPPSAIDWVKRWRGMHPMLITAPQPYLREDVAHNLTWLRAGQTGNGQTGNTRRRVLVAFCGNADRLMLPLLLILQTLPAAEWEVLKVTRSSYLRSSNEGTMIGRFVQSVRAAVSGERYLTYFRHGREGTDLDAIVGSVRAALGGVPPGDVTCFGTSSGARPAILVALRLGMRRCVTIGGQMTEPLVPLLPDLLGTLPAERPDFLHAFAADNAADRGNAERLAELFGGRLIAFRGIKAHGILAKVNRDGHLTDALNGLLIGQPFPTGMIEDAP